METQITRTYGSDPETEEQLNALALLEKAPKSWVIRRLIRQEYERRFTAPAPTPVNGGERQS